MSEKKKQVLDAIMQAMEIEKETFDLYTRAEHKTFNPAGKRVLQWLAKTEEEHYLKLTELYNAYSEGERWVFYGGSTISLEPEVGHEAGFDTGDVDALQLAMDIEAKAFDYFRQLADTTTAPEGREMFLTLAREEEEHLRVITEKCRQLKGQ